MEICMNETQAIQRLKNGDVGAMEELVQQYQLKAIRTACLITRDEEMARDAVQEAFLGVYQRIYNFDESRPFEPYLLRSVVNTAINMAEKKRKEVPLNESGSPALVEALISKAESTEDEVVYRQLKGQILEGLSQLPPRERAVIVERYYLGLSEKEMAGMHEVAPGTVKWLLNSARNRLRILMGLEDDQL